MKNGFVLIIFVGSVFILLCLLMKNIVKFWVLSLFLVCFGIVSQNVYAVNYTVNFVTNGGWTVDSQIVDEWENLDISAISVHRDWYTFSGWFIDSGFVTWFDVENDEVMSDLTLYAQWREHKITVYYHPNWWIDNRASTVDPLRYKWGDGVQWGNAVKYLYYSKSDWNGSNAAPDYAWSTSAWYLSKRWYVWHAWWLVWFTWEDAQKLSTTKKFSQNRKIAQEVWMLEEFKVWDIELDLYADWTLVNYTLTYTGLEDCTFENGENPSIYTMLSWDITLNNPYKTWYTFLWRSGTDIDWLSTNVTITWDSIGNRVFEAVWQINSYSITYDIDWSNKIIVTWDYNSDVVFPQDPERKWYKFLGWSMEIPEKMPAGDIVITARWERLGSSWYGSRWSSSEKNDSDDWKNKTNEDKKSEDDSKSDDTWNQDKNSGSGTGENSEESDWKIDMDDLMNVYLWARDNWITTWETLEAALPDGYIERWEMAKLVVDFVENVLWREVPSEIPSQCVWWDEKEWWSSEMGLYAKKSCALWLMGIYMKNFKPRKLLDRAEFGTIVSRMLWWEKFNVPNATNENKYYVKHLNEVKKENLITKIDNPQQIKELRKWIWTVLKKIKK